METNIYEPVYGVNDEVKKCCAAAATWSTSVATSAIGGGISAGLGGTGGPMQGTSFGMTVGRAIVGNALTQGVSVITGMQKEFNWNQVATSAVTAGVSWGLNGVLNAGGAGAQAARPEGLAGFAQNFGRGVITNTVMTVARGGRVQGEQIFTDAFGNALGQSVADETVAASEQERKAGTYQRPIVDPNTGDHIVMGALLPPPALPSLEGWSTAGLSGGDVRSLSTLELRGDEKNEMMLLADANGHTGSEVVSDAGGGAVSKRSWLRGRASS